MSEAMPAADQAKEKYKTLLFDLDGVILDFPRAEDQAFHEIFLAYGIEPSEGLFSVYREINHEKWKALERGEISFEECTVGRFRELFRRRGITADCRQFSADYLDGIGRGYFLIPYAGEVLAALYGKFRLYAVTNGVTRTQRTRLRGTGADRFFDNIFISEELGAQKPSLEYFAKVEAAIPDFDAETTLLIGDTLSSDIQGANNAGLDSCWINPSGDRNWTPWKPTYEISGTGMLPALLGVPFHLGEAVPLSGRACSLRSELPCPEEADRSLCDAAGRSEIH